MLTVSTDADEWDWVNGTLLKCAHSLPEGFERYCILLHPAYEAPNGRAGADMTVRELSLSNMHIPGFEKHNRTFAMIDELRGEFDWDSDTLPPANVSRIPWRNLAADYGIPYDLNLPGRFHDLWQGSEPVFLVGRNEGHLNLSTRKHLLRHLAPFTGMQACYFYYMLWANCTLEGLLLTGRLADIEPGFAEFSHVTPTYWWPVDRSWCLWTDYDCTFSAIGGPKALVGTLESDPNIDCIHLQELTLL